MDMSKLCLFSYNSRGFATDKQNFCKYLTTISGDKIPIVLNQENFLLRANRYKIQQCLPNSHIIFKPSVKEGQHGRPKGGLFISVPDYFKECVKDVSPPHWRVQAILVTLENSVKLIFNLYFPTDQLTIDFNDEDLLETIAAINSVIEKNDFNNVIYSGDFNTHFK